MIQDSFYLLIFPRAGKFREGSAEGLWPFAHRRCLFLLECKCVNEQKLRYESFLLLSFWGLRDLGAGD